MGLFLGRSAAKPKDLGIKLSALEADPPMLDTLILLRPEDDLGLSGKSKTLWQEAEKRGRHARLEAVSLDAFAVLYGFPRWLTAVTEGLPDGTPFSEVVEIYTGNVLAFPAPQAASTPAEPRAGFGFWLAAPSRQPISCNSDLWRAQSPVPSDLAMAAGDGGQRLYIVPSRDLVIARLAPSDAPAPLWSDAQFLSLLWSDL